MFYPMQTRGTDRPEFCAFDFVHLVDAGEKTWYNKHMDFEKNQKGMVYMTEEQKKELELQIASLVESAGIQGTLKGCHFLRHAIFLVLENPELQFETMLIYERIAAYFHTKATNVERNIRYAVADAYQKEQSYIQRISFRQDVPPSNSEIIAFFADRLRLGINTIELEN